MRIQISLQDGVPIYRQIVNQVKYLIASGQLEAGEELPAIRVLAEQLTITPNTVVKAYGELESDGLVVKRRGSGTFVADGGSPLARKEQRRIMTERADALLTDARQLDFTLDEVLEMVRKRHAALTKEANRQSDRKGRNHAE